MVRLDMSEYMEKHTVSRLIGAPPGYVGYDEGGQLTEAVRRRPYAVVLFDEMEKAHPNVLNILLQVLDDGRLTDTKGRVVNFKNTILIMTSNLKEEEFRTFLRPEFINRIDDILQFNDLGHDAVKTIVDLQLYGVIQRMADQGMTIREDADVNSHLVKNGLAPYAGS
jgi:ATP-dependent Clp protease ATP-binding subunit ClpB